MTFKLKSGNASAFKNLGSSPVKQDSFNLTGSKASTTPGYKDTKIAKTKNFKKDFEKFQTQKQKGKEFVKNLKTKDVVSKKPVSTLSGTTKAMKNVPKQFAKTAKTKMLKQVAKKALGRVAIPIGLYEGGKAIFKGYKDTDKEIIKSGRMMPGKI